MWYQRQEFFFSVDHQQFVIREIGHFIQDCPTNADPAWDLRPKFDYVCRACGRRGEHYITSCPRNQIKEEPAFSHPSEFQTETVAHDHLELYRRQNSREGRLSPWEVVHPLL